MYEHLESETADGKLIHNFHGEIRDMSDIVVETELFPAAALGFYTAYNLNRTDPVRDAASFEAYYNAARGGGQGDYRPLINEKIANVIDCLTKFPRSKRAVLTIAPPSLDHSVDGDAKCLRELHFYLEPSESSSGAPVDTLFCTGIMRAQAASIFPKNIHFIGTLMHEVAAKLGVPVGSYTHFVTFMFGTR